MLKIRLLTTMTLVFAASMMFISHSKAAGTAPGEGFYTGLFLGHGTGILQAEGAALNLEKSSNSSTCCATYETERGGLGLSGIQGGGWLGWGMKTADDLYFGAEITFAGSDERIELKTSLDLSAANTTDTISSASANRNWVGGGSVRAGYYVNSETLMALSGGFAVSQFDLNIGSKENTYYAGGPTVGASMTTQLSKIDPNLGLRMEFVYTNYLTAETNGVKNVGNGAGSSNNSELTGHDTAARLGVTYRF